MRHRMVVAALALAGLLLSIYLTMYHAGLVGALSCGTSGSCERVQLGPYGELMGLPVAAYGIGGYLTLLVIALAGLQPRWENSSAPTRLLAAVSGAGFAFTLYLKYLELFVIHAVCRWCVVSAVLIALIFFISLLSLRTRPSASPRLTDQRA